MDIPKHLHLFDRFIKLGVIGFLLFWGTVVLVKLITRVGYPLPADNDKDHYNDIYRLPDPYMTDEGLLKISFNNIRNETFCVQTQHFTMVKGR